MKRYYRNYKKGIRQKKYNEFKNSVSTLFTVRQVEFFKHQISKEQRVQVVKDRIHKSKSILVSQVGEFNAKRLLTYPCFGNGITFEGVCAYCEIETNVIHFDDDVSLCEKCASQKNLI